MKWLFSLFIPLVLIASLQYSAQNSFVDPDGFYHAKISQLLETGQLTDTFPWLPYTTWAEGYADQHFLYHWLLIPVNAIELLPFSIIVFALLLVTAYLLVLQRMHIAMKILWVIILLVGSADFLVRINLVKANSLSIALLFVIAWLVLRFQNIRAQKDRFTPSALLILLALALISGSFVWTYGGFVCIPLILGAYCIARWWTHKTLHAELLAASVLGIGIGLAMHPHATHIVSLLWDQLFQTGLGAGTQIPVGVEWRPYKVGRFIQSNIIILTVWALSLAILVYEIAAKAAHKRLDWGLVVWLQILAIGLVILTLWHRRFIEYWVPFVVLASAVTICPYMTRSTWDRLRNTKFKTMQTAGMMLIMVLCGFGFAYNIAHTAKALRSGNNIYGYRDAAIWLENQSNQNDIVVNTQWDQFPELFYWNHKNRYIIGMDPTFMYLQDPAIYWQWRALADDHPAQWGSIEQVHRIVAHDLGGQFLFIDKTSNPRLFNFLHEHDSEKRYFSLGYENMVHAIFYVQ